MDEQTQGVANIATAFAQLSAKATASANAQRLRIAQGNIDAGMSQLARQESVQRRTIARALQKHVGTSLAASAYRGVSGSRSSEQGIYADTLDAADQVAIVAGNRASEEVALIARNQVQLEDPFMAGIQGAIQGLQIGSQIAAALSERTESTTEQSSHQVGTTSAGGGPTIPVYTNTIASVQNTPGLNLADIFHLNNGHISFNFGIH